MDEFVKKLDFDSDTFEQMKQDATFVLQRLLGNMIEKGSHEGSMTIKIDVSMTSNEIPNFDPDIEGETRECRKPAFKHKVTSVVKINDEKSGNLDSEMELAMDEETGSYILRPVANTTQTSVFDAEYSEYDEEDDEEQGAIKGGERPALPFYDEDAEDEELQEDDEDE